MIKNDLIIEIKQKLDKEQDKYIDMFNRDVFLKNDMLRLCNESIKTYNLIIELYENDNVNKYEFVNELLNFMYHNDYNPVIIHFFLLDYLFI
jgi:hypothetical protein